MKRGGGAGQLDPFLFSLFILLSFHRGGKFSFCQFAEKKNRGTGRKLAISWKSKLPSAAETGASYFQKMAQALPSSIMHSGIQNRNKEMALDPKNTPFVVYMNPRMIQFRSQSRPTAKSYPCVSFAYSYGTGHFFRSGLLRDEYDTTYQIIKKKFIISDKSIICKKKKIDAFKRHRCALSESYFSCKFILRLINYLSIF